MDYFSQQFTVSDTALRVPRFQRMIAAFLYGVSRMTDPGANRSAERALEASRRRTDRNATLGAGDDWKRTGEALRDVVPAESAIGEA